MSLLKSLHDIGITGTEGINLITADTAVAGAGKKGIITTFFDLGTYQVIPVLQVEFWKMEF